MLFKLLMTERIKLKRSPVWFVFLLMPVIPAVLGTLNYIANQGILSSEWYSLWTQHTLFTDYFFLPIMLGIYCSYLMWPEHSHNSFNMLLTMPVSRKMLLLSKFLTASFMLFFSELWICALFVLSGYIAGLTDPPYEDIVVWCLFGTLGGMVMISIQLVLSMYIQSFAMPVGIAFAGGLSGLVFLAKDLGHIWPYSLMAYGMNSNAPQQLSESGYGVFALTCIAYILMISVLACWLLEKLDSA